MGKRTLTSRRGGRGRPKLYDETYCGIGFTTKQINALDREAVRRGVGMADVLRSLIEENLISPSSTKARR